MHKLPSKSTICLGDSRFVRMPTENDMSLCDSLSATSYAVNGSRATCTRGDRDCIDVMDQLHVMKTKSRIDRILLSIGGNDYMFCAEHGISMKECSALISKHLIDIVNYINECDTCQAGNDGKGCKLLILGSHFIPRLQFTQRHADVVDSYLKSVCMLTRMCSMLSLKAAGLSADTDFLEDNIHLSVSGINKVEQVIFTELELDSN